MHIDDDPADERPHGLLSLGNRAITETTALLRKPFEFVTHPAHSGPCNHGTFSPRPESRPGSPSSAYGFGGTTPRDREGEGSKSIFGNFLENVGMRNGSGKKKMSTTNWLAERHGITNTTSMYAPLLLLCEYDFKYAEVLMVPLQVFHLLYTFPGLDTTV